MKGILLPACVAVLVGLAVAAWGQGTDDEGFERIDRQSQAQIDRLNELLRQSGRIFVGVGVVLAAVVCLKVISPARIADGVNERLLRRAVRDVDELLKRIQKEAEATTEDSNSQTADEGILAGMTEVAEFEQAEQVPSYVLTVNDLMLDSIRVTLKRLRGHSEGDAQRYRDYMFSVLKGIKTITEQSVEAGVHSGLAVDIREYFKDERRYRDWHRLLGRYARRGKHRELAHTFVLFMKALKERKPVAVSRQPQASAENAAVLSQEPCEIPRVLNEETLAAIQRAAAKQARNLVSFIQAGKPLDKTCAWQFEFVRGQQQMHSREEAQRMLSVFLSSERKSLLEVTKIRMLPCRAWEHVLHMLGAESGAELHKRIEDRLLTIQEIILLEKAFLQTLARKESLARVYGQGEKAALMMDMHVPEIRREALALLRKLHQMELKHVNQAMETLNEEETPQNDQVRKLIEHYVHHGHNPPGTGQK
jgi:hypothetical protein